MKRHRISIRILFFLLLISPFLGINAEAIRIAVMADIHVTPGNENDKKLTEVIKEINKSDAKIAILAGDLTNEGSDEQLYNVKSKLDAVKIPLFVIPGNHENTWSQSACKTFNDIWGQDRFVYETDDLVIVGINCGPFMKMGDGHIKQEDLSWLDRTLKEKVTQGKRVLSVCHYPILDDLDNCNDYIAVLQKYPVIGHICGHYHTFKQYKGGDIDALMCRALDMRNGNYGYSILDISADSVKLFDKQLNTPEALKFAYKINNNIQPLKVDAGQENKIPSNVEVKLVHRDEASIFTRVALDKDNFYIGNSLGEFKSVNKNTGKINWSYKTNNSLFSRAVIGKRNIIVPCSDKRLIWLDKKTGMLVHEESAAGPYVADGILQGNLLYQGGYKIFEAWNIDKKTREWKYDSIFNYCQASPAISKNDIAFGAWDTNLRMLDKKAGALKWYWNNGRTANMLGPGNCVPVITDDKVIVVAPDRYMTAIDRTTGKQLWRSNQYKWRESLGVSEDGTRVYAKTMDGELACVSTQGNDYKLLWVVDAGLGYEHAPCLIIEKDGVVYMGSRRGVVVAVEPISHKILWKAKLGTSEVNGFDVDKNGDIYLSLIEGTVWKIHNKK